MQDHLHIERSKTRDGKGRIHWIWLSILLVSIFLLQLWLAWLRHYSFYFRIEGSVCLFSEDLMGFLMQGRQFADFGWTTTFLWPGYMYHAPVESIALFAPALLIGFHEWIPVFMMAVFGTLIPFMAYVLARMSMNRNAGLMALALTGATDPFVAGWVFMLAWPFLVNVALSMIFAWMTLLWVRRFRMDGRPPRALFLFAYGFLGGVLFYAHPVNVASLVAAALFLLLTLGRRIFSRVLIAAAAGFVAGSIRLWIFWAQYFRLDTIMAWQGERPQRLSAHEYFFGSKGFFWYMFSPSG